MRGRDAFIGRQRRAQHDDPPLIRTDRARRRCTSRPTCCASWRRVSTESCGHRRGGLIGDPVRLGRGLIVVSCAAAFEIRMPGGEHSSHVIRQRQKRAHRNVCLTTRWRCPIVGCRCNSRGRTRDCALTPVRQPDDDQRRSPPRPSVADRKALAIQGMMRINDPDLSNSSVKRCGISKRSAMPR